MDIALKCPSVAIINTGSIFYLRLLLPSLPLPARRQEGIFYHISNITICVMVALWGLTKTQIHISDVKKQRK